MRTRRWVWLPGAERHRPPFWECSSTAKPRPSAMLRAQCIAGLQVLALVLILPRVHWCGFV